MDQMSKNWLNSDWIDFASVWMSELNLEYSTVPAALVFLLKERSTVGSTGSLLSFSAWNSKENGHITHTV